MDAGVRGTPCFALFLQANVAPVEDDGAMHHNAIF
jgi:hypothetical protein